jgi:glutamine amidotransferase
MIKPEVTVIDYGVGNLRSVQMAFEHVGVSVKITSNADDILKASKLILPGVGAFRNAMNALNDLSLIDSIKLAVKNDIPLLGICLGMQLLFEESEEFGLTKGLGLLTGKVVPIPDQSTDGNSLKVPHIGWSKVDTHCQNKINQGLGNGASLYFVHSYMASLIDVTNLIASSNYGGHVIPAIVSYKSIYGCQFHPEKSGRSGLMILKSFCEL